jgi:AraC-like DNA-binding protein
MCDKNSEHFFESFKHSIVPQMIDRKLTIVKVSEMLNMNVRTLQRKLNRAGWTYSDLIDDIVINDAAALLRSSELAIRTISQSAGYAFPSHFTRAFKRKMGVTPSQY